MPDPETGDKSSAKVMLLILCEKDCGRIVVYRIIRANQETIRKIFVENVLPGSIAYTDEAAVYREIPEWGNYEHDWVNHSEGGFVHYDDQEFISSNKVKGVNSALKKFLRKHNGFVFNRVWLALEEYIYHRNNSGSAAYADVRTVMRHVSVVVNSKTLLQNGQFHSVYWEYQ
ncbi:hypothetical protein RvY_16501 [Ramazzottius varieornatus]|uniref:ISXO2-like transposase domain-containing protein n=1 Tax=Ramazzottius varieornatus TaxID=947166 RepID=A0A1D1VYP4_RAMVA|nr:hypothetical protein RvY_16501 [Ramazzottius varieornatus]